MNICMFTNTYLPHIGGVARSVRTFTKDLRDIGHRVLVVAPEFEGHLQTEPDVIRLAAIQNFNGSDFSVRIPLPYVVENEIEAFKPDIIHSHHPFLMGDTALRVSRKHGLPLVFTHHTLYEQYTHYMPMDSELLRSFVINLATIYANFSDGVVAPSGSIAHLIHSRGVQVPIVEIPTGVDMAFFSAGERGYFRQSLGIPDTTLVLGHVGRLAPEKNLVYLSKAITQFLSQHSGAVFLVVGDGTAKGVMLRHFQAERMQDRIFFPGQLTSKPLSDAYAAMDLFVFASFSETQGMVLLEAMAAGVPVIALDASGVRDVVVDGYNGLLLPDSSSPEAFAAAILDAVAHPSQLEQWQKASRQVAQLNSRQSCARRLEKFYQELLSVKSPNILREKESLGSFEALLERIKVEWELFAAKVKSAVDAVPPTRSVSKEQSEFH